MAKIKPLGNEAVSDVKSSDVADLVTAAVRILKDLLKKSDDKKK